MTTRAERVVAAHLKATTGVSRRCMVKTCPSFGVWEWVESREAALLAGQEHYRQAHYVPPAPRRR